MAVLAISGCGGSDTDFSKPLELPKSKPLPDGDDTTTAPAVVPDAPPATGSGTAGSGSDEAAADGTAADKLIDAEPAKVGTVPAEAMATSETNRKPATTTSNTAAGETRSRDAIKTGEIDWLLSRTQASTFSQDGRYVATGSADGTLRMFDVEAGALARVFPAQHGGISAIAISPSGSEVGVALNTGRVRFWPTDDVSGFDEYQRALQENDPRTLGLGAHTGQVTALAWQPGGKLATTSAVDGTVKLWSLPPTAPARLGQMEDSVTAITVGGKNQIVATASRSGQVTLWDLPQQSAITSFRVAGGSLSKLRLVPGEDLLVGIDDQGAIVGVEASSGREVARLTSHAAEVTAIHVAGEGRNFISADKSGVIRTWNLPLRPAAQIAGFGTEIESLAMTLDQKTAAVRLKSGSMSVLSLSGQHQPLTLKGRTDDVTTFAFTGDGSLLAAGTKDGLIRLWSVVDGQVRGEVAAHQKAVTHLQTHPKQTLIATAGADGKVRLQKPPTSPPVIQGVPRDARRIAVTPDSSRLVVLDSKGVLRIWTLAESEAVGTLEVPGSQITTFAVSNQWIATGSDSGLVRVVTTDDLANVLLLRASDEPIDHVAIDQATQSVAVIDQSGMVRSFSLAAGNASSTVGVGTTLTAIADSERDDRVVAAGADLSLKLLSVGAVTTTEADLGKTESPASVLATTADRATVISGHADGAVEIHGNGGRDRTGRFETRENSVSAIAVRPDGSAFASAHNDGSLRVWELPARSVLTLTGHSGAVNDVAVSPDSKLLASVSEDRGVRLWEVATGKRQQVLNGHKVAVKAVVWLDDGTVVTGDAQGTLIAWNAATGTQTKSWKAASPVSELQRAVQAGRFFSGHTDGSVVEWTLQSEDGRTVLKAGGSRITLLSSVGTDRLAVNREREAPTVASVSSGTVVSDTPGVGRFTIAGADGALIVAGEQPGRLRRSGGSSNADETAELTAHAARIDHLAWSGKSPGVSVSNDGLVSMWDEKLNYLCGFNGPRSPQSLAVSTNGEVVVLGTGDGNIKVYFTPLRTIIPGDASLAPVAVAWRENNRLTVLRSDLTTVLIDAASGQTVQGAEAAEPVQPLVQPLVQSLVQLASVSADWKTVAAVSGSTLIRRQAGAEPATRTVELPSAGTSIRVSQDGSRIAVTLATGELRIHRAVDLVLLEGQVVGASGTPTVFHKNGRLLIATKDDHFLVQVPVGRLAGERGIGRVLSLAAIAEPPQIVALGADGNRFMWTNSEVSTSVVPVPAKVVGASEPATLASYSSDGRSVVAKVTDSTLSIGSALAEGEAKRVTVNGSIRAFAVTNDGSDVAVSTTTETVVVSSDGEVKRRLPGVVNSLSLSFAGTQSSGVALLQADGGVAFLTFAEPTFEDAVASTVDRVAFSGDGQYLAAVGSGGLVKIWQTESHVEHAKIGSAATNVSDMAFSGDARTLVLTTLDGTSKWNLSTATKTGTLDFHNAARLATTSRGGARTALVTPEGTVRLVASDTGELLDLYRVANAKITSVALASDGMTTLAGTDVGTLWRFSQSGGGVIEAHPNSEITDAVLTTDGNFVVSTGADGRCVLHQSGGTKVREFAGASGRLVGVVVDHDQKNVVAVSSYPAGAEHPGQLNVWSFGTGDVRLKTTLPFRPLRVERAPSGDRFGIQDDEGRIHIYETSTGAHRETILPRDAVEAFALAEGGGAILTGSDSGRVAVSLSHLKTSLTGHSTVVTALNWSPDGRYVMGGGTNELLIWEVSTGDLAARLPVEGLPLLEPEKDADAKNAAGKKAGREKAKAAGPNNATATMLHVSQQGDLAAAFTDGSARVWKLSELTGSGTPQPHTILRHPGAVASLRFSSTSNRLVTGCADGVIRLWNLLEGKEETRFVGHEADVVSLAFNVEESNLFSTGIDRRLRVWPVTTSAGQNKSMKQFTIETNSDEQKKQLQASLKNAQQDQERTRLRSVLRELDRQQNPEDEPVAAVETSRIAQLRMALRQQKEASDKDGARQKLLAALREEEIRDKLSGVNATVEREQLTQELQQIQTGSWSAQPRNTPAHDAAELDARFVAAGGGSEAAKIREQIGQLLRESSVWPAGPRTARYSDTSHLLAEVPTSFQFDAEIFSRVELALSHDGRTLAAARQAKRLSEERRVQGVVRLWDVPTQTELRSWTDVAEGLIGEVHFASADNSIYTAPDVFTFDLATGLATSVASQTTVLPVDEGRVLALGIPGRQLETTDVVSLLDLQSLRLLPERLSAYEAKVTALAVSHDGTQLAACLRERNRHRLVLLDPSSLTETAQLETVVHKEPWLGEGSGQSPGITWMQFAPRGSRLIAYGQYGEDDMRLTSFDLRQREEPSVLKLERALVRKGSTRPFVFMGNTLKLVIDSPKGIGIVDLADNITEREIPVSRDESRLLCLSADGTLAAYGAGTGEVTLMRLDRDDDPVSFRAHQGPVVGVTLSDDGRKLITAGEENRIRIWTLSGFHYARVSSTTTKASGKRTQR